jgi:transmembrane protein EpsG
MLYYTGLLVFVFATYGVTNLIKNKETAKKIFFFAVCVAVVLFQGFRSFNVGTDLVGYLPAFSEIGTMRHFKLKYMNYEAGYIVLNRVLYMLGFNERQFLIAISAIVQVPIFYTISKYSEKPLISVLWYFSFGNFVMTFSGLRQSIAMALCFLAYFFIKQKKLIPFILLIIFASLFHSSALFCLLLYPAYFIKITKKSVILALGTYAVVFIMRSKLFAVLSKLYYEKGVEEQRNNAFTMLVVYLLLFVVSFLGNYEDEDFIGLRNILFLTAVIYSFAPMHNFVTRIAFPLTLYMTIYIPKFINSFIVRPKWLYHLLCCGVLTGSFYYIIGGLDTLPFSFG